MDLYLIPGLGADRRLFSRLDLGGHTVHHLEWPDMPAGSTLVDYAQVLAKRVDRTREHALIGVSMGGMVAQELSPLTGAIRIILISTWISRTEMPLGMRALRGWHPERLITAITVRRVAPLLRALRLTLGLEDRASQELGQAMLSSFAPKDLRVMVDAIMRWDGPGAPVQDAVRIHGDKDRLMPIGHIKNATVIQGGTHFMVFSKAEEVSAVIRTALGGH